MLLSPKLKWKFNRYGQNLENRLEKLRHFLKLLTHRQRMCPACRSLIDAGEAECTCCGQPLAPGGRTFAARILGHGATYTTLAAVLSCLGYAVLVAAAGNHRAGGFSVKTLLGPVDSGTLIRWGARYGPVTGFREAWRLVAPLLLHASLISLLFNCVVLFDVGPSVEQIYGSHKFVFLYVLAGSLGSLAASLWRPHAVVAGSSTALFGMMGAMAAYAYKNRGSLADGVIGMFARWSIYALIYGLAVTSIGNIAHLAGLAAGGFFGLAVSDVPPMTRESIYLWRALHILAGIAVAAAIAFAVLHRAP